MSDIAAPGIGHNKPDDLDMLFEPLEKEFDDYALHGDRARVAELVRAANLWIKAFAQTPMTNANQANSCQDFMDQLADEWKAIEAKREERRKPLNEELARIQKAHKTLLDLVVTCGLRLKALKTAYLNWLEEQQAKQRRLAEAAAAEARRVAEEAARAAAAPTATVEASVVATAAQAVAERAEHAADSAAVAKPQVVGTYSGRASGLRTTWSATVSDWSQAAAFFSNNAKVREAVQAAANAMARTDKEGFSAAGCSVKSERVA